MQVDERLKRAIALRKDDVFLRTEFARFGSQAQLSRAFRQLIAEGVLVKLGLGVWTCPRQTGHRCPVNQMMRPSA